MIDTVTKLMGLADDYADWAEAKGKGHCAREEARQALQDELVRLFTPLTDEPIKEALIQSMSLLEFAKACNGVTVFDHIALDEALSALHKAMQEGDRLQAYMLAHKERIPHGITGEKNETA